MIHQLDFVAYLDGEHALGLLEAFYGEKSHGGIASAKFPLNHVCLHLKSPNPDSDTVNANVNIDINVHMIDNLFPGFASVGVVSIVIYSFYCCLFMVVMGCYVVIYSWLIE